LHQLLQQKEFSDFFDSGAFEEMLIKVGNDDVASYKNSNKWLIYHPNEALLFNNLENVWKELKAVYNSDFKNLVYGALTHETAVYATLNRIKTRLSKITWTIQIENKKSLTTKGKE